MKALWNWLEAFGVSRSEWVDERVWLSANTSSLHLHFHTTFILLTPSSYKEVESLHLVNNCSRRTLQSVTSGSINNKHLNVIFNIYPAVNYYKFFLLKVFIVFIYSKKIIVIYCDYSIDPSPSKNLKPCNNFKFYCNINFENKWKFVFDTVIRKINWKNKVKVQEKRIERKEKCPVWWHFSGGGVWAAMTL